MFSYQNTLTEPQTVHAEGNQYTCDMCNKSFAFVLHSAVTGAHTDSGLST